jgi:hypothetical protein
LGGLFQIFSQTHLTRYLPVSTLLGVTSKYHELQKMSRTDFFRKGLRLLSLPAFGRGAVAWMEKAVRSGI